ncbi:MAG: DUF481 domain-containing protein [Gemmatimonadota bacterium]
MKRRHLLIPILAMLLVALVPGSAAAQKTDTVTVRNGDRMVGEIKGLERGQLEFKTDAMSTVYAEWPKVVTITTDKIFEIQLADGTVYFGSLRAGSPDSVVIHSDSLSVGVPTQSVVELQRIKSSFWAALDGNINLGLDFTQQNAKTDLNLSGEVHYAARRKPASAGKVLAKVTGGFALTKLSFNSTLSRQDDTDDIQRGQVTLSHARQLENRWFWVLALMGERNSQLSLDFRASVAAGAGRFLVQSNKLELGLWTGPSYSREQFTGESGDNTIPFIIAADLHYFTWGVLNTSVSSQLSIMPILNQWGRWRINFGLNLQREVLKNFYINLGVTEAFDSDPTAADANKNDFGFTTSFGWTF